MLLQHFCVLSLSFYDSTSGSLCIFVCEVSYNVTFDLRVITVAKSSIRSLIHACKNNDTGTQLSKLHDI